MPFLRLLILALLLSGCATENLSKAPVAPYRDNIELNGRISVNYMKKGVPDSLTVNFAWNQVGERVDVTLSSMFRQTLATIVVTPQSATLTQSDHAPRVARDIDALTAQTLGWSLPVTGLRDWMQGYATAADGTRFAASPAANTVTTQDGWRLRFVSWQDADAPHPVPRRIDAERSATSTTDELAIRIVLDAAS